MPGYYESPVAIRDAKTDQPAPSPATWLTQREAAEAWGLSRRQIVNLIESGRVETESFGGRRKMVLRHSLEQFMKRARGSV